MLLRGPCLPEMGVSSGREEPSCHSLPSGASPVMEKSQESPRNKATQQDNNSRASIMLFISQSMLITFISLPKKEKGTQTILRSVERNRGHWQKTCKLSLLKEAIYCSCFSLSQPGPSGAQKDRHSRRKGRWLFSAAWTHPSWKGASPKDAAATVALKVSSPGCSALRFHSRHIRLDQRLCYN